MTLRIAPRYCYLPYINPKDMVLLGCPFDFPFR